VVNDAGLIVGSGQAGGFTITFVNGTAGTPVSMEGPFNPRDVNNAGLAVGANNFGSAYSFLTGGYLVELGTTIAPDSGWSLRDAFGVNDTGLIVGNGLLNGEPHGFLLTPVGIPEPSTGALFAGVAVLGSAWLRRGRRDGALRSK
jgi:hypothetical protein